MTNHHSHKLIQAPFLSSSVLRQHGGWEDLLANDLAIIWSLVSAAWAIALFATITGYDCLLHYDSLFQPDPQSLLLKFLSFLLAWQVMVIAMMLPTSLPLIRLFIKLSQQKERSAPALLVFLTAYLTIWLGFAVFAFFTGWGAHSLVNTLPGLQQRPWLISGATLLLTGAFQFSKLKEHCMTTCRHPFSFLVRYYQQGLKAAWNLGIRHGLYCLGCCWALMLVMFVVGVEHITWMLLLTGVMVLEKTSRWSQMFVSIVGGVSIACGLMILYPNLI